MRRLELAVCGLALCPFLALACNPAPPQCEIIDVYEISLPGNGTNAAPGKVWRTVVKRQDDGTRFCVHGKLGKAGEMIALPLYTPRAAD